MLWIRLSPPGARAGAEGTPTAPCADLLCEILGCRALRWARDALAAWTGLLDALGVGETHRIFAPFGVDAVVQDAARHQGAALVEVDLDPATGRPVWPSAEHGPRGRSVYVLDHRYGLPYPAPPCDALIVEDATASVGGAVRGRPVGSLGAAAVVTLGAPPFVRSRGALVVAHDADLGRRLETQPGLARLDAGAPGEWQDLWDDTRSICDWVDGCRAAARVYTSVWRGAYLPVRGVEPDAEADATYSAYLVLVPDAEELCSALAARGVETRRPLSVSARRLEDARGMGWPGARAFHAASLQLPNHPDLGLGDLLYVADALSVHLRSVDAEGMPGPNTKLNEHRDRL
jgi:dTDP-4-amino-4,6-dideoxygalactose transaminase